MTSSQSKYWTTGSIALIVLIVFLPLFNNGFVEWDDWYYITHNKLITSFSLSHIWTWFTQPLRGLYQPLIQLTFALDYAVDGLNPAVFHATNLLIHITNAILVYYFVFRLTGRHYVGVLTALLFGIHPMHVESVAWATERKDTLYALFFLAGLSYYLKYIEKPEKRTYNLVFLMLILSLLSKGSAVAFPFVLVLIDFLRRRKWLSKEILLEKAPFFILAFAYGLMTFYFHYRWGAARNHTGLPMTERLIMTAYSFYLYLEKLALPVHLSALYPIPYGLSAGIYGIAYLLYFIALAISFFKNRLVFFGLAFFLSIGLFLITVGVPIIIADRFTYIPSIGLFIVFAYGIDKLFAKTGKEMYKYLVVSPLILVFGYLSYLQAGTWHDDFSLWDNAVRQGYEDCQIRTKRASALIQLKRYDEAMQDINRAIALDSTYVLAYSYRGYLYNLKDDFTNAKKDFQKVIRKKPDDIFAINSLGYAEYKLGNYDKALEYVERVLAKDTANFYANKNKAYVLMDTRDSLKACIFAKRALRHIPKDVEESDMEELKEKAALFCP